MLGAPTKRAPRCEALIKQNPPRGGLAVKMWVLRLGGGWLRWLVDDLVKLVQLGLAFEGDLQGRALLALDPVPSLAGFLSVLRALRPLLRRRR